MKSKEKPVFKCGIVRHRLGSPYLSDISNVSYVKKASKLEELKHKTDVVKKNSVADNEEKSFAPPNFRFKVFIVVL
jgi:hypothetical protein